MSFGRRLFAARKTKGLSIEQTLAQLKARGIKRTPGWLYGLESDRTKVVPTEVLSAFAEIFDKPLAQCFSTGLWPNLWPQPLDFRGFRARRRRLERAEPGFR